MPLVRPRAWLPTRRPATSAGADAVLYEVEAALGALGARRVARAPGRVTFASPPWQLVRWSPMWPALEGAVSVEYLDGELWVGCELFFGRAYAAASTLLVLLLFAIPALTYGDSRGPTLFVTLMVILATGLSQLFAMGRFEHWMHAVLVPPAPTAPTAPRRIV